IGLSITFTSCEKDGLTEEEILNLAQATSFTVEVTEQGSGKSISGVEVSVLTGGVTYSLVTDEFGVAVFENIEQGQAVVNLKKEGYFESSFETKIEAEGRASGDVASFSLYSLEDAVLIKGNVKIQIDLTTDAYEHPEGITIAAVSGNTILASAVVDSDGNYSMLIPASVDGRSVTLMFPDVLYDQKIAVREDGDIVMKTAKGTIFRPYDKAEALPSTANILATIAGPNYTSGRQAYVESLTVESGVITGVELGDIGYGYSIYPAIYINSLNGGSGANIQVDYDYNGSYCSAERYRLDPDDIYIYSGGSGYPDYEPNVNVSTMHPSGFKWSNCDYLNETETIKSGDVYIIDVNYGTGTELGEIQ
ncbi:hypothetical protein, partial [Fulvivirga kasyanovii]